MVLIVNNMFLIYDKFVETGDPDTQQLPFVKSPLTVVVVLLIYNLFVHKIGPKFMENKKPYNLRTIIQVYNIMQVIGNAVAVFLGLVFFPYSESIFCIPQGDFTLKICHYFYYLSRILDLLDTVFFVLRKKYNQITFLHLYHHIIMVISAWGSCKFAPGGQLFILGFINVFVHMVMYFYYFVTSWKPEYKKKIWWKRHLTRLQIAQHYIIFILFSAALLNPSCTFPKLVLAPCVCFTVLMIYLFTNFYIKTYVKKNPSHKTN